MQRLTLLAAFITLGSACSLLVDTDPYVSGTGDSGATDAGPFDGGPPTDGEVDAAVDPTLPTAPVVAIAPANPRTADDLVASVEGESVDPMGGSVSYQYAWFNDGSDAGEATNTVTNSSTSKGEVWRVEITPVADSDGRRGPAGVAMATIVNTPPTVGSVRLSDYRPILGDTLIATPVSTFDADGEGIGTSYRWLLDGVEISDATSNRLDTGMFGIAADSPISVELTVRDSDEDGGSATATAVVLADVTRWRQLLPNRTWRGGRAAVYDKTHDRVLIIYSEEDISGDQRLRVWEYALDRSGDFAQLHPTGSGPALFFSQQIYDEANGRIFFFGMDPRPDLPTYDVYVLDISERGNEAWSVLSTIGPSPSARFLTSVALDRARDRVLVYGGTAFGDVPFNELWTLDISRPGFEAWTQQTGSVPGELIIGGGFVVDAARDRALLVAGGEWAAEGDPSPSTAVYSLDLTDLSDGFRVEASTLPSERFLATAVVDPATDRLILANGFTVGDVQLDTWMVLNLASLSASEVVPDTSVLGQQGFLVQREEGWLYHPGGSFERGELSLYEVDLAAATLTPVHVMGVDLPPGLREAVAGERGDFTIFGGEDHRGTIREEVWRLSGDSFVLVEVLPDAVDGTPGPRAGINIQAASPWGGGLQFFGGRNTGGTLADAETWLLRSDSWIHQTYETGASIPPPLEGAAFYDPACGQVGYFGGRDATGRYQTDTGHLACSSGERQCTWNDPVQGARPPGGEPMIRARAWATVRGLAGRLASTSHALAFGGTDGRDVFNDIYLLNVCGGGPQPWDPPRTIMGTPPPARWGHTMSLVDDDTTPDRLLVFGGSNSTREDELHDAHFLTVLDTDNVQWDSIDVASGPNDDHISARMHHMATWDWRADRLLVYGGVSNRGVNSDLWELRIVEP